VIEEAKAPKVARVFRGLVETLDNLDLPENWENRVCLV
jgi:hypothetical protein